MRDLIKMIFWKKFVSQIVNAIKSGSPDAQADIKQETAKVLIRRQKNITPEEKKAAIERIDNLADEIFDRTSRKSIILHRIFPTNENYKTNSKLGGLPNLPLEYDWPVAKRFRSRKKKRDELPMHFLAQIDCSEIPEIDIDLPKEGILFFFGLVDECSAWDQENEGQLTRVIFVSDVPADTELREPPANMLNIREAGHWGHGSERLWTPEADLTKYPEWPVIPLVYQSYPDAEQVKNLIDRSLLDKYDLVDFDLGIIHERFDTKRSLRQKRAIDLSLKPHLRQTRRKTNFLTKGWQELLAADQNYPKIGAQIYDFASVLGYLAAADMKVCRSSVNPGVLNQQVNQAYRWMDSVKGEYLFKEVDENIREEFRAWFYEILERNTNSAGKLDHSYTWAFPKALRQTIQRAAAQPKLWKFLDEEYLDHMWEDHEPYPDVFHDRISEHFCHNLHQLGGHFQSSKRPIDADDPIISLLHLDSDYGIDFMFGDVAEAQFFIQPEDLKNRNFDKATARL